MSLIGDIGKERVKVPLLIRLCVYPLVCTELFAVVLGVVFCS
jgi:hypothetical protein